MVPRRLIRFKPPQASFNLEKLTPWFEDPRVHLAISCVRGRHSSELVLRQKAALRGRNATAASSGSFRTAGSGGGRVRRKRGAAAYRELLAEQAGGELAWVSGVGRLLRVGWEIT